MFESLPTAALFLTQRELETWLGRLAALDTAAADPVLIDQITALEKIKSACAAAQAALTLAFHASRIRGLSPPNYATKAPTATTTLPTLGNPNTFEANLTHYLATA